MPRSLSENASGLIFCIKRHLNTLDLRAFFVFNRYSSPENTDISMIEQHTTQIRHKTAPRTSISPLQTDVLPW